jgi:hypothetical protein
VIKKELAGGQLYQMQEKQQTTRKCPDKYIDTKPRVIEKELAEGQLYQMQEKQQTTREDPDRYIDTKPTVMKNELAGGQPYQMRAFGQLFVITFGLAFVYFSGSSLVV